MEEVDFDNAEEMIELEARLYAQIHHEVNNNANRDIGHIQQSDSGALTETSGATAANTGSGGHNSNRYWVQEDVTKPRLGNISAQTNSKYRIHNQSTSSEKSAGKISSSAEDGTATGTSAATLSNTLPQETTSRIAIAGQEANTPRRLQSKRKKNNLPTAKIPNKDPVAGTKKKLIKNPFVKRANDKGTTKTKSNGGPFQKQHQKLERAKLLANKKQKSKLSALKQQPADVINLMSSDESDCSDVVLIPVPPPPTFTVDDSEDDTEEKQTETPNQSSVCNIIQPEENALDSTDVQLCSGFIKPQATGSVMPNGMMCDERRIENSSRCTSPCSIQSSDDFIGQTDRSRLKQRNNSVADDEDLLLLTSDVNSLMETPGKAEALLETGTGELQTTPQMGDVEKKDYRVDGAQFRALDVYESESDITDSVYSKGLKKTTVIRQIDTSSGDDDDINSTNQRAKRLRKRRCSSGNKSSDTVGGNSFASSDDDPEDHDDSENHSGAERTCIPFISRGIAVERKVRKRSRTLSTGQAKTTTGKYVKSDHMSDKSFIAQLQDLVQCQDDDDADESDEAKAAPSAREIAKKILGVSPKASNENAAMPSSVCNVESVKDCIPENGPNPSNSAPKNGDDLCPTHILDSLSGMFQAIDNMSKEEKGEDREFVKTHTTEGTRELSEMSDTFTNKVRASKIDKYPESIPPPQPIKKFPPSRAENGSPIYNVVYRRTNATGGGLGWNEEMRNFYEKSWNGENLLSNAIEKMNQDKNLWRIHSEDRYKKPSKRQQNLKCTNCCEFGHARYQCRRPQKPHICYMCGQSGHQEPRCPNTICLRCGNKTQVFVKTCNACSFQNRLICPICKNRGHSIDHCPDKWRRYYATTEPNIVPVNNVVYNPRKFCSLCGLKGHLADGCRRFSHFMEYPSQTIAIKSHQKSYSDIDLKSPLGEIGINLMYEPDRPYRFNMAKQTTSTKYYGRYLNAVGLSSLIPSTRTLETAERAERKKAGKPSRKNETSDSRSIGPHQVQEVTESGRIENVESSTNAVSVESSLQDDDIQLNIVTSERSAPFSAASFKSPNRVSALPLSSSPALDSDSNYSFSEHFDNVPSTSSKACAEPHSHPINEGTNETAASHGMRPNFGREMAPLQEFIPLVDSDSDCDDVPMETPEFGEKKKVRIGISKRFIIAESEEENGGELVVAAEPCEAKIYLTYLHSKYLLSPVGQQFLANISSCYNLTSRLDFTSVGHVLVVFGLPEDQDKFQRELLSKYRELSENNNTQMQCTPNVPKRIDALIRFLRDDINLLYGNLGNANHLFRRLQHMERQQSKAGMKTADKLRRTLNMILIGQAGLQEGEKHLEKLLQNLKSLVCDYQAAEVTPQSLRSEITSSWKVIFSPFRHSNYQDLIGAYNRLLVKNRLPNMIIDTLLLGQKMLDISLTEEQKNKLEQTRLHIVEPPKSIASSTQAHNQKATKANKRKLTAMDNTTPPQNVRSDTVCTSTSHKTKPTLRQVPTVTPASAAKKPQQHQQKSMPPPSATPENKRTKSMLTGKVFSEKCRMTCDTLLSQIASKSEQGNDNDPRLDAKKPSMFWSRQCIRYLDECASVVAQRPNMLEKLKRIQSKAQAGQLSYNDYLAVTKIHTALKRK